MLMISQRTGRAWLLVLGAVFAFVSMLHVPPTATASCLMMSDREYVARADIIALGTIHQHSATEARLTVERYFKGGGPAELRVTGRYDPNAFTSVDYALQDGTRYLLFLRGSADSLLKTSDCAGNRPVAGELRAEELRLLGPGTTPDEVAALLPATSPGKGPGAARPRCLPSACYPAQYGSSSFGARGDEHDHKRDERAGFLHRCD